MDTPRSADARSGRRERGAAQARRRDAPSFNESHHRLARQWSRQPGASDVKILESASASAVLLEVERGGFCGEWFVEDVHYIDMCLTRRPRVSRGCFVDESDEFRETGRIFLAPAGRRLRFETSSGRQRTLGLFLPAAAWGQEAEDGSDALEGVLFQCLHIWSQSIRTPLRRIAEELRNPGFASPLIVEGLSLVILGELSRLMQRSRPNLGAAGGLASWRLNLIQEMVQAGGRQPSLADLAFACRMSPRHLMRAFRKETGLTLGAYMEQVVFERAKRLLRDTQSPIATIAAQAGFATPAGFSAAFRRAVGQSPREFRSSGAESRAVDETVT